MCISIAKITRIVVQLRLAEKKKIFFSYCAAAERDLAWRRRRCCSCCFCICCRGYCCLCRGLCFCCCCYSSLLGRDYDYSFILSLSPVLCCNINMCVRVCECVCAARAINWTNKKQKKRKKLKTIINTHNKIKFLLCFENTWMSLISPRTYKNIQKETESTWTRTKYRCGLVRDKGQGHQWTGWGDANRKLVTTKTLGGCMYGMINHNLSELSTTFMTQKERKRNNALSAFLTLSLLYSNKLLS